MEISNNTILITGGATGIGLGLAERFLKEKNTVIICGRRKSVLEEVAQKYPSVIFRACDLSIQKEREELFQWISNNYPNLNVLINNAGIQQWMGFSNADFFQRSKEEITINIEAPLHLISLFATLKSVKTIINVTSALAYVPLVKVPVYSATKSFFHSYTQSLKLLLKPKGIEIIEIIPPALNTDLGGKGIHNYAPPVSGFIDAVFEQLKEQKDVITFGYSESMIHLGPDELQTTFNRMNLPKED
jgi:uncharacterized oxidoreductase